MMGHESVNDLDLYIFLTYRTIKQTIIPNSNYSSINICYNC